MALMPSALDVWCFPTDLSYAHKTLPSWPHPMLLPSYSTTKHSHQSPVLLPMCCLPKHRIFTRENLEHAARANFVNFQIHLSILAVDAEHPRISSILVRIPRIGTTEIKRNPLWQSEFGDAQAVSHQHPGTAPQKLINDNVLNIDQLLAQWQRSQKGSGCLWQVPHFLYIVLQSTSVAKPVAPST